MTTNEQPMDHAPPEGDSATEPRQRSDMERNVTSGSTWMRLLFMLIVAGLYAVSRIVLGTVVVVQFFFVLFTGENNEDLKKFGRSLAIYSMQVVDYLTFNTETRPFPLDAAWPTDMPVE